MANKKLPRLLFIDPNKGERDMPPNEDLSISVELKSITRGRSVISGNGEEGKGKNVNNFEGESSETIGFLDGTNIGGGRRSLTTNYTQVNTNFNVGGDNDLESLGIESINIKFDTAITPIINVKFIDIRGQAVLQQGSNSKYKMFFELPYPLFELTVKGFYGKAVTYCLHLTNWNASFNSSTGNFEINADFIGYTYALLTDCMVGYMRASALTERGQVIFNEYKNARDINGFLKFPNLITIDEFLNYVNTVGINFEKLKENSDEIKQINALTKLAGNIKKLNGSIIKLGKDISKDGVIDKLNSNLSDIIMIPKVAYNANVKKTITTFKEKTQTAWDGDDDNDGLNERIEVDALKIDTKLINDIKITNVLKKELEDSDTLSTALLATKNYDNRTVTDKLAKKITRNFIVDVKETDAEFTLFDFDSASKETEKKFNATKDRKKAVTTLLTDELKRKVGDADFKPTIKNIIDIFTIHGQIFLKTLRQVSIEAEESSERTEILKKRLGYDNMDMSKGKTIYPWPEYKSKIDNKTLSLEEEDDTKEDNSLYETWIGSRLNGLEYTAVPEIEFVEEILEKLMKIAKEDENRALNGFGKTPLFFPVSPVEAPISFNEDEDGDTIETLITQNPYYNAIVKDGDEEQKTTPYEAYRCLLMRGFNGLGLANRTTGGKQIEAMGRLEADNLWSVIINDLDKIDRNNMIDSISNLGGGSPTAAYEEVLKKWETGVADEVINPPNNKDGKLLKKETVEVDGDDIKYYTYTYLPDFKIDQKGHERRYRTYIPVSGGFNCKKFISSTDVLKRNDELKELSSSLLFVGNGVSSSDGWTGTTNILDGPTEAEQVAEKQEQIRLLEIQINAERDKTKRAELRRKSNDINATLTNTVKPKVLGTKEEPSDGAIYLKILDEDKYREKQMRPPFGNKPLNKYIEKVGEKSLIKQSDLPLAIYENGDIVADDKLNRYNGQYSTLEISNIIYDFNDEELGTEQIHYKDSSITNRYGNGDAADVMSAYYFQYDDDGGEYNGTFLASKPRDTFKEYTMPKGNTPESLSKEYKVYEDTNNQLLISDREKTLPINFGRQRELVGDVINDVEDVYLPYVEFSIDTTRDADYHYSLFGSRFYYRQDKIGRAFLFLHCISWHGVYNNINDRLGDTFLDDADYPITSMFDTAAAGDDRLSLYDDDYTPTLKGLFGNAGSFIKAPKLWCAFIGGLLYRYDNARLKDPGNTSVNGDIIDFGTSIGGILPHQDKLSYTPKTDEYLYEIRGESKCGMHFLFDSGDQGLFGDRDDSENDEDEALYVKVDQVILGLPTQAREEFKRVFLKFVEGDFKEIQKKYELFESFDSMVARHDDLLKKVRGRKSGTAVTSSPTMYVPNGGGSGPSQTYYPIKFIGLSKQDVIDSLTANGTSADTDRITKAISNYDNISPIGDDDWLGNRYVMDLTLRHTGTAQKFISGLFGESYMIMNNRPSIFRVNNGENELIPERTSGVVDKYQPIRVDEFSMHLYMSNFFSRFNELTKEYKDSTVDEDDKYQKKIFNTIDDDSIKLSIYRNLSSINTKWLGGELNNKCANIDTIAESFKYMDSSFYDIGNEFLINPKTVYNKIINNYNQSLFDVVNTTLSKNDFNFIALPSFVNFRNEKELEKVFEAYPYNKAVNDEVVGPSFVCVYVGQTSTNLNLGKDSEYEDDGVYIHNDGNGNQTGPTPEIFKDAGNRKSQNIPYFLVSYGKANQSFFKDVKLDQREFAETAESLEIIEDISQQGDKRRPSFSSQNLFNVYQKRSYSAEVEMMGNAMIQPFMYFQLNNIPLFRGAYLINSVSHSITPHNMTTRFKGQRIKNTKTKLIDESELFMNLLGPISELDVAETITDTPENKNEGNASSGGSSGGGNSSGSGGSSGGNNKKTNTQIETYGKFVDTPMDISTLPINNESKSGNKAIPGLVAISGTDEKLKYGIREVVELLHTAFSDFIDEAKQTTDVNETIFWNDISFYNGGVTKDHLSHQIGIDIDFRQILSKKEKINNTAFSPSFYQLKQNSVDGTFKKYTYGSSGGVLDLINPDNDTRDSIGNYSRKGTRMLINQLRKKRTPIKTSDGDIVYAEIDVIYFNDPVLIDEGLCSPMKHHDNHLHVRFKIPGRVEKDIADNSGENSRVFYS